ncbi:MAG: hypothetical protein GX838_00745 [Clostridiaceae bacterium]|nr:hypothetical protein [Clostridiaceae bacterium]
MGFSLEALVAVPCCLSILAHLTGLAGPVAAGVKTTGAISAYAALRTKDCGSTCRHYQIERVGAWIPAVETCPQKVVEMLSFVKDLAGLVKIAGEGGDPP